MNASNTTSIKSVDKKGIEPLIFRVYRLMRISDAIEEPNALVHIKLFTHLIVFPISQP